MKQVKNIILFIFAYLFFVCLSYLPKWMGWAEGGSNSTPKEKMVTDTVYVPAPYWDTVYVPVKQQSLPAKLKIYKPDSTRRARIEKGAIISGVRLKPGTMQLEKLEPTGLVTVGEFRNIPAYAMINIDAEGRVLIAEDTLAAKKGKKAKIFKSILNKGVTVGLIILSFKLGGALSRR